MAAVVEAKKKKTMVRVSQAYIDGITEAKKKDTAAVAEARKKAAEAVAAASNMAAAGAGAGNMVAEAKKKKKMVRVNQAYIDGILEMYPFKPFPCDPEEIDKTIEDPETRELLKIMTASVAATVKACRDKQEAIIQQYYAKGYAEEEIDSDDDDDVENGSEGPSDVQRQEENNGETIVVSEETSASLCSLSKL